MAYAAPRIIGNVGGELPLPNYNASIIDSFPQVNRNRNVETGITDRYMMKIPPTNNTLGNSIVDKYVYFEVNGNEGTMLDMSTLGLEIMVTLTKNDNTLLGDDLNIVPANSLLNTLFRTAHVYVNDRLIESSPCFNYQAYIKSLVSMKSSSIKSRGRLSFHWLDDKGSKIQNKYEAAYFQNLSSLEKKWVAHTKQNGLHLIGSLFLDITSLDQYLLDNVGVKVKLEMNPNSWIINSDVDQSNIKINLHNVNLLVDRVTPRTNALLALHQALSAPSSKIDYLFTKMLQRSYTLNANQTTISINNPFGQIIPEKLYLCFVKMNSFTGSFTSNGLYFGHENLQNLHVTINGSTVYDINSKFPHDFSQLYFATLKTIGTEFDSLIHFDAFNEGRTVIALNFKSEFAEDTMEIDKSGNLRLEMTFDTPKNENRVILLLGESQGVLSIDGDRNVECHVRG